MTERDIKIGDEVRIGGSKRVWVVTNIVWNGDGADLRRAETGRLKRVYIDTLTLVKGGLTWESSECRAAERSRASTETLGSVSTTPAASTTRARSLPSKPVT